MPARNPAEQGAGPPKDPHREEFEFFFAREYPRVVAFLMMAHGIPIEAAQDTAQEAFISLFQTWDSVQHPRAWLRAVSTRIVFRQRRGIEELVPFISDDLISEESTRRSTEGAIDENKLLKVMRTLPSRQRHILALTYDGFTPSEISEVLQVEPTTVRSNLRKARRALADRLESIGGLNGLISGP